MTKASLWPIRWRTTIHVAGFVLTVLACMFVLREVVAVDLVNLVAARPGPIGTVLVIGIVIYALLDLLLAATWWRLVHLLGPGGLRPTVAVAIYAVTQSYKYMPSNLLHFVGRHAAAAHAGGLHTALAGAAILEAGLLIAAAAGLAAFLGADPVMRLAPQIGTWWELLLAGAAAALIGLASLVAAVWAMARRDSLPLSLARLLSSGLSVIVAYVAFFLACSVIVMLLLGVASGDWNRVGLLRLAGCVGLSWTLGFVVPGAPAGVGVREAVLIFTLEEVAGRDASVAVAALYRLTTLGGDMIFAAAGLAVWRFIVSADKHEA